jgi:PIN domain nuclease of toxin-antitoxin system
VLLDTHFVIWAALGAARLREFPWFERHLPWNVSPVSLLEMQFLGEVGRLEVEPEFFELVRRDSRFVIDEPPLDALIRAALPLSWTRDPFDRMLCAHSLIRRMPLCSLDRAVRKHHALLAKE